MVLGFVLEVFCVIILFATLYFSSNVIIKSEFELNGFILGEMMAIFEIISRCDTICAYTRLIIFDVSWK